MSLATPQPQTMSSEGFKHQTGNTEPTESEFVTDESGNEEQYNKSEKRNLESDGEKKLKSLTTEPIDGDTNPEESNLEYVSDEEDQKHEPIDLTSDSESDQEVVIIEDTPNESAERASSLEITQVLEPLIERQIYVDLFSSQYRLFPVRGEEPDECLFEDAEVCEASLKGLLEYIRQFLEHNNLPFRKEDALTVEFSKLGFFIIEDDVYADDISLYDIISLFEGLRQKSAPEHRDVFLTLTIRSQERFINQYTKLSTLLSEGKGLEYIAPPPLERKRPLQEEPDERANKRSPV